MSLSFNAEQARKADRPSSIIRETGKYVGVITRAEKLLSRNNVQGVGLSFKSDDGGTASYLDVYTVKADGTPLWGANLIQSLLGCLKLRTVEEGEITFDKWDREVGEMVKAKAPGYPVLMGKRIGFVLQKELQSHHQHGGDVERLNLVRVFQAETGLTSTEILDRVTTPKALDEFLKTLQPVRDSRKKSAAQRMADMSKGTNNSSDDPFGDDINF